MLASLPDEIQELVWLWVAVQYPNTAILASRVSSQTRNILNQASFWQKACQIKGINVDPQNENLASLQRKLMPGLAIDLSSAAAHAAVVAARGEIPQYTILVFGKGCYNIPELTMAATSNSDHFNKVGACQLKFDFTYDSIHYFNFPKERNRQPQAVLLCPYSKSSAKECIAFANRNPDILFFIVPNKERFHLAKVMAAVKHKNILIVPQDYNQFCKTIANTLDKIMLNQVLSAPAVVCGR